MGETPEKLIRVWLGAVEQNENTTGSVRNNVTTAGNFLWKTVRLGPRGSMKELLGGELTDDERKIIRKEFADVIGALKGFDFKDPVKVLNRLPDKVYVQYIKKHRGHWFTDTGLTEDAVGLAGYCRKRELFQPKGAVCALQGTAAGIRDSWSADKLIEMDQLRKKWDELVAQAERRKIKLTDKHFEATRKRLGQLTRGGGTQYFVPDPHQMEPMKKGLVGR